MALVGVSLLFNVIVMIILLKKHNNNLSSDDLKKVRLEVMESVNILGQSVSSLIAEKNQKYFDNLIEINKETNELVKILGTKYVENYQNLDKLLTTFTTDMTLNNVKQKDEIINVLKNEIKSFNEEVAKVLNNFNQVNKERLEDFKKETKDALIVLNQTVEKNLKEIRDDNNLKLDKINQAVNEKLEKTLENQLKNSFETVIKQISNVNEAVGEIKGLANDVGSLKNVLTNVKTKGIIGEVILGNIIKEFLAENQYEENVITKKRSTDRVEYAIKLPGQNDNVVYLPVDSKFPYEVYSKIISGNDIEEIKQAKKELRNNLLKYAKDVSEKYIDVPNTTDFAIIFLPLEGLYLEALEDGLFEEIQSKYKINLTGPTTFTAFINALQIGFKSLAIQKKSADVFNLLRSVKAEFNRFAEALEKTQKKMNEASDDLETLVGTRTRKLNVQLRAIESFDEKELEG